MSAGPAYTIVSVFILFSLASATACAQGLNTLDITLPSSYMINGTTAYSTANNAIDVWGPIEILKIGGSTYATVPANAPRGSKLAFFRDTSTGALFRNNTLMLTINSTSGPAAGLGLMTGDMTSDGTRFYGQVTDVELDSVAMGYGDALVAAVIYLNEWPDRPSYHISISNNETVKKAIASEASKSGQAGGMKLMLDVSGDSISYIIVRMKAPEASGNVSAFRYEGGRATRLPCKEMRSNDSVIYETISSGGGTFAFFGPFPETMTARADLGDLLIFSGTLGAMLLLLVGSAITAFRKVSKKG